MIGTNTASVVAGRMEICFNNNWREVCHNKWDLTDAQVVCRQLGFSTQGTVMQLRHCRVNIILLSGQTNILGAASCTNSCFGFNDGNLRGFNNVQCVGNETRLADCPADRPGGKTCPNAGVICGKL